MSRLPTYFISHGGGPWPWIKDLLPGDWTLLESSLRAIPSQLGTTPTAVLAVSAHWERQEFTLQTAPSPPTLHDYGGFPDFTYAIQYPAPGSPAVAERTGELLSRAGLRWGTDDQRGFDHGTFVPLHVIYPDAEVPVLQMSIRSGYDPAAHIEVGRAIAPLRDEGVLILGSGLSYHNLTAIGPVGVQPSADFDNWLHETLVDHVGATRSERLLRWESAPGARRSHPSADHLIPLMVAVGAAEDDPATLTYHDTDLMGSGITASSFGFGLRTQPA